jgi:hypothetical protein
VIVAVLADVRAGTDRDHDAAVLTGADDPVAGTGWAVDEALLTERALLALDGRDGVSSSVHPVNGRL